MGVTPVRSRTSVSWPRKSSAALAQRHACKRARWREASSFAEGVACLVADAVMESLPGNRIRTRTSKESRTELPTQREMLHPQSDTISPVKVRDSVCSILRSLAVAETAKPLNRDGTARFSRSAGRRGNRRVSKGTGKQTSRPPESRKTRFRKETGSWLRGSECRV